jgi:hypothetical protein
MNLRFLISVLLLFGILGCDSMTTKEQLDKIVYDVYHTEYDGIVVNKYIDEHQHYERIIKLKHEIFGINKIYFRSHSNLIFNQIKIGDTILKERKSLFLQIKRKDFEKIIKLDFDSFKRYEKIYRENQYLSQD